MHCSSCYVHCSRLSVSQRQDIPLHVRRHPGYVKSLILTNWSQEIAFLLFCFWQWSRFQSVFRKSTMEKVSIVFFFWLQKCFSISTRLPCQTTLTGFSWNLLDSRKLFLSARPQQIFGRRNIQPFALIGSCPALFIEPGITISITKNQPVHLKFRISGGIFICLKNPCRTSILRGAVCTTC